MLSPVHGAYSQIISYAAGVVKELTGIRASAIL
jgi:hypothetical protein